MKELELDFTSAYQAKFGGKKRSDLKDSDFLFPETRSFPITTEQDVRDAISNFGRYSGKMSYKVFLNKIYEFAKKKGQEFVIDTKPLSQLNLIANASGSLYVDVAGSFNLSNCVCIWVNKEQES